MAKHTAPKSQKSERARQLAKIHIAAHAAGLDDELYRDVLQRVTGKRSAAELEAGERVAVLVELRRLATGRSDAKAEPEPYSGRPASVTAVPLLQKVEALLADQGRPWRYAHALAKRMFRVSRLEWCNNDQLRRLVAALQIDANRRNSGNRSR